MTGAATGTSRRVPSVFALLWCIAVIALVAGAAMKRPLGRALPESAASAGGAVQFSLWLAALLAPAFAAGKSAVLGGAIWAVDTFRGAVTEGRALFHSVLASYVPIYLEDIWSVGVIYLRGMDAIRGPADLLVPTGLDVWFDISSPVGLAMAKSLGLFSVLSAVVLFATLRSWCTLSKARAGAYVALVLVVRMTFGFLRAMFLA